MLPSYIDEFNWRQKHKGEDVFKALFKTLSRADPAETADATEEMSSDPQGSLPSTP